MNNSNDKLALSFVSPEVPNRQVKHVGWFVAGDSPADGMPYAYGDVFISVYAKEEQRRSYQNQNCKLIPVYVPA